MQQRTGWHTVRLARLLVFSCCLWASAGENSSAQQDKSTSFVSALDAATNAVGNPNEFDAKIAALLALFPQTTTGYYIVDGDIKATEADIRNMVRDRSEAKAGREPWPVSARQGELIVMTEGGAPTCYRTAPERRLTYAIDKNSFASAPDANAFEDISKVLADAMRDWEKECPECGINFVRLDTPLAQNAQPNFIVRYIGPQGTLLASAFFPKDVPAKRYLDIAQGYYTSGYDRRGVLRHEVAHILGYRHEHIRPETPFQCYFKPESKNWTRIASGDYDSESVTHYPCVVEGKLVAGSYTFALSKADIASHRKFYLETCR